MSEADVFVLDPLGNVARELTIRVNGDNANFLIRSDRLAISFLRNIDDRMSDFIDIVSSIFAADSRVRRGSNLRPEFGQRWRRRLRFRFYLRDPDFWRDPQVSGALRDAVEFMSDDILELEFEPMRAFPTTQVVLDVGPNNPIFAAEEVILFSGGLDSLSGAFDHLASKPGNIILLSHISANKRINYAKNLVDKLKERFPNRILWVPVAAHLKGEDANETTQRTRSLLFACLGFVTAQLSGAKKLHFYENGIVSANLPISAQVIGTMASRTTHPQTLTQLAALLRLLAPATVELSNPFSHLTKSEVARRLADHGGAKLIRGSVSCSHVRQQTILHPHCGSCSQCLDRRFGILAAGLAEHDPDEGYEFDVLVDERHSDASRILALDWVRHALRLAEISDGGFLTQFGTELARLVAARPELSSAEHARSIIAMHRRHGRGVQQALANALAEQSSALLKKQLPETSLLRMTVAEQSALPTLGAVNLIPFEPDHQAAVFRDAIFPLKVRIESSADTARVIIEGLGEMSGKNVAPVLALRPFHEADRQAGIEHDKFKYVRGGQLAKVLDLSKETVRQRIKRLRDGFAEQFLVIEGFEPEEPILIKSNRAGHYRLDPSCMIEIDAVIDLPKS